MALTPTYYEDRGKATDVCRDQVTLTRKDIVNLSTGARKLTRQNVLSLVMGVYDTLGLISAALVQGKILLRRLYSGGTVAGWDKDLDTENKKRWATWLADLESPREAQFPRTTRDKSAVGQPRLVGFCDAAVQAICAVLYVVWEQDSGPPTSHLLMSKCRVAPLHGATIPQEELQSLVILHCLAVVVVEAFPAVFQSISKYTDSMCSLGALQKMDGILKPYFANQASEIRWLHEQLEEVTEHLELVHHIAGSSNPANLGTRGQTRIQDLGPGKVW